MISKGPHFSASRNFVLLSLREIAHFKEQPVDQLSKVWTSLRPELVDLIKTCELPEVRHSEEQLCSLHERLERDVVELVHGHPVKDLSICLHQWPEILPC